MKETVSKSAIIIEPGYPCRDTCNVRAARSYDAAALAAGRLIARDLPLSGEWIKESSYQWGDQPVACFARWNKVTRSTQIEKAHGSEEDLYLDPIGNLWELRWNSDTSQWDHQLVG